MHPTPSQPDMAISGSIVLPAHCTTVTAEELRVRLVLASDYEGRIAIDASQVESLGQAVLQLLVAARAEADSTGRDFAIINPSGPFAERVTGCRVAELVGLAYEKDLLQ